MIEGPFYHGTKADLQVGELIERGFTSNYGSRRLANFVYLTATLEAATWGAELAVGEGRGRIYIVEPTGPIGQAAIAATTVAVERVVLVHLREQLRTLEGIDAEAVAAISRIVADEQEHHDRSATQAAEGKFWPAILSPVVALSTESVIWLGMRL